MKIDVTRAIGAVTREVKSCEHDSQPVRVVVASRTFDTTIDDVWDALTNLERIPRWFLPISGELRLGGRYQFQGNAGGTITGCDPPRSFAVTWEFGGSVSWVAVLLDEREGRTRLDLEHAAPITGDQWAQFGPGAAGVGWDMGIMGLGEHLSGSPAVTPEDGMQWAASDEGRAFIEQSSLDWCRASIAFGTPEADAKAAAERTRTAYTGGA